MTEVAVRLPGEMVAAVDRLVADGIFTSRSEVVRVAVAGLLRSHEEDVADQQIVFGYLRLPQEDSEISAAAAATRALVEAEPW